VTPAPARATGSRQIHLREQKELIEAALQGTGTHLVRAVSRSRANTARARRRTGDRPGDEMNDVPPLAA